MSADRIIDLPVPGRHDLTDVIHDAQMVRHISDQAHIRLLASGVETLAVELEHRRSLDRMRKAVES